MKKFLTSNAWKVILSKTGRRSMDLSILDVVTTRGTIAWTRNLVNSSMDRSRIPIKLFRSARETCQETRTPARILAKQNRRLHWRSRSHLTIPWIQTTMHHEADLHNCECFLSSGRLEKSFGLIITIFMQSRLSLMGLFSRKFVRKL